jgi:hypothetical protein
VSIKVYPNKLTLDLDGLCDEYTINRRTTIAKWLDETLEAGYTPGDFMPVSFTVDGETVYESEWSEFVIRPKDNVIVCIEPRGTDPFSITIALFAGVKAAFGMLMPKLPGTPNTPGQGESLSSASAKGNKVKLGQPIREAFGTNRIYPDYIVNPRKYFSDPRTQWLEMGLSIGVGRFQISANNVRIGDTSILSLGNQGSYQIYQPGSNVSGNTAFENWYPAPEVGSNSTGAAGLELGPVTVITQNPESSSYVFNGFNITIPSGAGSFPADWVSGVTIRVVVPYEYTVTDGGGLSRDIISGPLEMLNPSSGDLIEVAGTNAGQYEVFSYTGGPTPEMTLNFTGGAPANGLVTGTGQASIGPSGLRFRISARSGNTITVDRLTAAGATDSGFPGFNALTTSSAILSVDSSSLEGGYRGPFPICPEGEVSDTVEWDVFYPEGICLISNKGAVTTIGVDYAVEYRDMAIGGAWTSINYTNGNATLDQLGYTERLTLPYPMRAEFRMRKISPLGEDLNMHSKVQWYGLRSRLPAVSSYEGITTIGLRIQISDRIASQTENQVYVIGTRILPTRDSGTWQPETATNQIVPAALYALETLQYTDSDFDLAEFDRLDQTWRARGDTFNLSVDSETTAFQFVNDVLSSGFAEMTLDRGRVRPVRDEPRSTFEHMYTPHIMTENLVRNDQLPGQLDDYDGVDLTYKNGTTWSDEIIEFRLPGDAGVFVEKIEAKGVTNYIQALRIAARHRRIQIYRREQYSWGTEMAALNSRYLSYCSVSDDVPGYGQTSLLVGFTSGNGLVLLESSEPLDWSAGGQHVAALRRPDGTLSGPYTSTRVDDYRFTVPAIDFSPDTSWVIEPPHIQFGPMNRWSYPVLVTSISPRGTTSATVEAVGYNAEVYLDDDITTMPT